MVHWVCGKRQEVLRYLGVSKLGRNFRLSDCNLRDPISMRRHCVCIVPFRWHCILCRRLDEFHSSLLLGLLPCLCQQCILVELIPV